MKGMISLAKCALANWKLVDELSVLEPSYWDREWLVEEEENDIDLL
jgi:hypothetical protein